MSPSWRERFEIAVRPDEVSARRLAAGWRSRESIAVQAVDASQVELAIVKVLDELAPRRRVPAIADVVISEAFARYTLVPWSPQVHGRVERAALLRVCFADLYGDVDDWAFDGDRSAYGLAAPAFAVDQSLLTRITSVLAARRISLRSFRPLFAAVFNRHRHLFETGAAVFAVADAGWATLATTVDGRWNSLRSVRVADDGCDLQTHVMRERLLQGLPNAGRTVVCTLDPIQASGDAAHWELVRPWGTIAQPGRAAAFLPGRWPQ